MSRRDGKLLKDIDSMHFIMPLIYPNRCDNEAYFNEMIDLTNLDKYLEKKNSNNPEYKYNLFQAVVTATLKTITLRSKMNRFIANGNLYERYETSAAFTVKKEFSDDGDEVLCFIHSKPEYTIEDIHNDIYKQLTKLRKDNTVDASTDAMDTFQKLPRFISKTAVKFVCWLDKHGWVPQSLIETDPYYSSCVLANLGSIGIKSGYHHLTNWGTTGVFITIGKAEMKPFFTSEGTTEMRRGLDVGFIIDERLADGFYYARTIRLFKLLLETPELLDLPLNEKLTDELWEKIK